MPHKIHNWLDIQESFSETLLLGNGASVAVHEEFGYGGLFDAAEALGFIDAKAADIFKRFETNDFELVLRHLWHAKQVNAALDISVAEVDSAYAAIQTALIRTVQHVHISYADARPHLTPIYAFMRRFKTVLSLNYDLIVYWAAQFGNDELGSRYHFKDVFNGSIFTENWGMYRGSYGGVNKPTIFCYPHGNIAIGVTKAFAEEKLVAGGQTLLDSIFDAWQKGTCVPLFVCDGTSKQKLNKIQSSPYLRSVYSEPLTELGDSLVIYGWGLADQEDHILTQIKHAAPRRVAVSVYDNMQAYCDHAHRALSKIGIADIQFFHSHSRGAWNNVL